LKKVLKTPQRLGSTKPQLACSGWRLCFQTPALLLIPSHSI